MKLLKSVFLLCCVIVLATACTRKPLSPKFEVLAIDTLIGTRDSGCTVEYRFATIDNAAKSPALQFIEQTNIAYFFELGDFSGSAQQAADAAIQQHAQDYSPPGGVSQIGGLSEISVESEGTVVDSLVTYIITRSSYTGGAHGIYGTECHTYSLAGGYELSTFDLFSERQLIAIEALLRRKLYLQYDTDSDEGLANAGFFPNYIALTENFSITSAGITFYYNPYEIGCYALGAVEVSISREELDGLL